MSDAVAIFSTEESYEWENGIGVSFSVVTWRVILLMRIDLAMQWHAVALSFTSLSLFQSDLAHEMRGHGIEINITTADICSFSIKEKNQIYTGEYYRCFAS